MKIFYKISEIKEYLLSQKANDHKIGFIPTMGTLHLGHLSLIEKAKADNLLCVCSIFINPLQFNNKEDLANYPKSLESDIIKLESVSCDILFAPSEKEIYPETDNTVYDLGGLDKNMEGAFRPGHFNGVAVVVKKMFDIIEPLKAYFGEKDFQQLAIIKSLVKKYNIPVEIVQCPTIREADGLAMSSRNLRLLPAERKAAPLIYMTLNKAKEMARKSSIDELKELVINEINKNPLLKLEYFEIVDCESLEPVSNLPGNKKCIACIATYVGNVRLIDNINFCNFASC